MHEDGRRITYGELEERCHRLANALRARGLRARRPRRGALAERARDPRGALRRAARRRRAGRRQHAPRDGRDRVHPAPLGRADAARRPRARAAGRRRSTASGLDVVRIDDTGRADDPYEQLLAAGAPERPECWLVHEEEPISINYTSGTTGAPKGVVYTHRGAYLNALSEVIVAGLTPRQRVPLDAADVPLQRLVLPVGRDRRRRAPRDRARRRRRARLGADRERGRDALQRRARPCTSASSGTRPRTVSRAPVTVLAAAAPPSPTLFARLEELNFRVVPRLRPDRDLRADHGESRARRLRRAGRRRARARARAPGAGVPDRRPRARRRRRAMPTSRATGRRWARS